MYALTSFVPSDIAEQNRIYQAGYDAELKGEADKEMERYSSKAERVFFMLGVVTARRDQWKKDGKE